MPTISGRSSTPSLGMGTKMQNEVAQNEASQIERTYRRRVEFIILKGGCSCVMSTYRVPVVNPETGANSFVDTASTTAALSMKNGDK